MNETNFIGGMALSLQAGTAAYAFRLNRLFGMERTGWALVGLFALMWAAHAMDALGWTLPAASLQPQFIQLVISTLLLIGVAHLGLLWRQSLELQRAGTYTADEVHEAVAERTEHLSLANQQLSSQLARYERLHLAQESEKLAALGRLAGGLAHHFNNLLTIIQGTASVHLASPGLSGPLVDSFQDIQTASERAAEITRDLVALGRGVLLRPETVDLNTIIRQGAPELQQALGDRILFGCQLCSTAALVSADPAAVQRVLVKLAVYAREGMPAGGHWIVRTSTVAQSDLSQEIAWELAPGRYGCITLIDNGSGVAPDVLERLFEPFPTPGHLLKESCLGLSAAYGVVRQHGGLIRARSRLGQGTTFEIYLPEPRAASAEDAPRSRQGRSVNSTSPWQQAQGPGETVSMLQTLQ